MRNDYLEIENREILDTKSMLEDGFFKKLGNSKINIPKEDRKVHREAKEEIVEPKQNYNTEQILLELFDTRDSLIDSVSKMGLSFAKSDIVTSINKIGNCIRILGGKVEDFDPFENFSGLQVPAIHKNAKRVIENTKESYSLGKISDAKVDSTGTSIEITFEGERDNMVYKAIGTIVTPKAWIGNEAIDYIYTPNEGRMSVKAFNEEGKWIDRSANYKISWELNEIEKNAQNISKNVEEKEKTIKKEIAEDDDDIGDDFPISEK